MPGQQREHQPALLTRSARQGITLQHLLKQRHGQPVLALGCQTPEVGAIGRGPGAAAASGLAPPARIGVVMLFKALQDPIEIRGRLDGARLACALIRPLKAVVLHLLMHLVQPLQGRSETIRGGGEPEAEALNR